MWKSIATALALALAGVVYWAANPEPACAACSVVPCTVASQCGSGCSCLKIGSDSFGTCVTLD